MFQDDEEDEEEQDSTPNKTVSDPGQPDTPIDIERTVAPRDYEYVAVPQYLPPVSLPSESLFSLHPVMYDTDDMGTCCAAIPEFGTARGTTFSRTHYFRHVFIH